MAISERRRSWGKSTERVKCSRCEFTADIPRNLPLGSKPEILFIINRGPVFERAVTEAIKNKKSIKELTIETGISPLMWKAIFHEMGFLRGVGLHRRKRSSSTHESKFREKNRRRFREYLGVHPDATRTRLNKEIRGPYRWLVANDREWYLQHAPERVVPKTRFGYSESDTLPATS